MHALRLHLILLTATAVTTLALAPEASGAPLGRPIPGERQPTITDFWKREAPAKTQSRAQRFRRALKLIRQGLSSGVRPKVINAPSVRVGHTLLGLLAVRNPKEARYWYWYGYASLVLKRYPLTIKAWKRVWKLEPDHWDTSSMAFELGILYAKRRRYAESVAVYRRGIPASFHLTTRSIMASNCAESLMALGKVRRAVTLYRLSLRLRPRGNNAAWWGLMLAYDRGGLTAASERARSQALTLDPNLRGLAGPAVFFVPTGDVHYYLALAYEGQGRIRDAADQWVRYLRARPRTRWKKRVLLHQARLKRIRAKWKPRVYLVTTRPQNLGAVAAGLMAPIDLCYRRRAKRVKILPQGRLPLYLTLKNQRISSVRIGWSARQMRDPVLKQCIIRRLQNRRLPGTKRARIVAVFHLERGP
jgi:tetratricopeptide (TPR) repeat protein